MSIDPIASLAPVDALIASRTDEREKRMLGALRDRMIGEAVGELDPITRSLAPEFTLMSGGASVGYDDFVKMMGGYIAGTTVMWLDWAGLTITGSVISGWGLLHQVGPAGEIDPQRGGEGYLLSSADSGVFLRFEGDLLVEERLYSAGPAQVREIDQAEAPTREALAARLGANGR